MAETKTKTAVKPDGLYPKLLAAQSAAQAVAKQGRNEQQGYDYARAADVIEEAQRALHEAGLIGFMRPGPIETTEIESNSGSAGLFVTLTSTLRVIDPETGDELEVEMRGTGVDYPGDKAIYKAMTGAAKYAYASLLGIPFGDDPEAETGDAGQARKAGGAGEATGPQKGAITRILNKAGVVDREKRAIVHAIAGDPPTKAGASKILDAISPVADKPAELAQAVAGLREEAGVTQASDVPGDDEGLPSADPGPEDEGQADLLEDRAEPVDGHTS